MCFIKPVKVKSMSVGLCRMYRVDFNNVYLGRHTVRFTIRYTG